MSIDKSALLVIDMQLVAFDGKVTPPIRDGNTLLDRVAQLIELFRNQGRPVVYLQTCAFPGRPYAKDVHGWEIHPRVQPQAADSVFDKVGPSAFENAGLETCLKEQQIDCVVVCGIWSEGCVAYTCDDALARALDTTLIADAHGTVRDSDTLAEAVVTQQNRAFARKGGAVVTLKQFAQRLEKRIG